MAKLGDICTIYSGTGFPVQYQGTAEGQYPFYKVGDIAKNVTAGNKYLVFCENYVEADIVKIIKGTVLPARTVVFAKIGEAVKLNRRAITSCECLIDNNAMGIAPNESVLTLDYFFHYMCSIRLETLAEATTVPSVKKSLIEKLDIPLPSLLEQEKISTMLNKVSELIALRKEQLAKLDQLVKSRFIELFGDPVTNSMGWNTDTVNNLCQNIYGGGTPSKAHPEYYENGDIPWVSSKDMKTDILYDSQIKINQLGVDNSTAKMVPVNSVIMVIRSGILKHTLPVAINAVPITVNQDLKVFVPSYKISPVFLLFLFKMLEKDILTGVRAVTADNIEFNTLKERLVIVPPIALQEQFAAFVEQTDKSKLAIQQSLNKLELLKKSLMQEYFG